MKSNFFKTLLACFALSMSCLGSSAYADDFDISIGVGGEVLPGVYGRVNITNERYPALVYAQPLIIQRAPRYYSPIYLHVPPGHMRKWDKHCNRYGACARPVYFVRSPEYRGYHTGYIEPRYIYREDRVLYDRGGRDHYAYREGYRDGYRDDNRDDYRDDRRRDRRDDRWERRKGGDDDDHGKHGNGRGHGGHGRGRDD